MTANISIEDQTEAAVLRSMGSQCVVEIRVPAGSNWYPSADNWEFEDITPAAYDGPELFLLVSGDRDGVRFSLKVVEYFVDSECLCDPADRSLPSASDPDTVCAGCGHVVN